MEYCINVLMERSIENRSLRVDVWLLSFIELVGRDASLMTFSQTFRPADQ